MFDCIIVGAGPAGGSAAYHLAKRGRSVLVLEKESLPRYKPCGGGVSPAIAQWFDFDFTPAISMKVDRLRYTWQGEDPVEVQLETPEPMWMVRRDIFDQFLIDQAKQQGAEVRDNSAVTQIAFKGDRWQVTTATETLEAKYLIAADGAKGPMAKMLGFKERDRQPAAAVEITSPNPNALIQFDFGRIKKGYIWNFPKADGYSLSIANLQGGTKEKLDQILTEYAQANGFPLSTQVHQDFLCLWEKEQKLHTQNAILAGEAACVVDPLTAEGIRPSMFSGVKAAESIDAALAGTSNALEQYTQVMNEEWGGQMVWASRVSGLFYKIPKIAYKVGIKRPSATQRMVEVLCGETSYADIANKAIDRLKKNLIPGFGG
ncbi:geranylgeranyl reductase family protein [Laspinema sp. D1]|nr:geranylgeranyl reductase family protein [Laspinema sp. D2b]